MNSSNTKWGIYMDKKFKKDFISRNNENIFIIELDKHRIPKYRCIDSHIIKKYLCDNCKLINCSYNNLTNLDCYEEGILYPLPKYITNITCTNNNISRLPNLPINLTRLYASSNKLTILPKLPESLQVLECTRNKINYLPEIPSKLLYLYCYETNLQSIPILPKGLRILYYEETPIYNFINTYFSGLKNLYFDWKNKMESKFIIKIEDWFLECKYNPKYTYCQARVNKDYDELLNDE